MEDIKPNSIIKFNENQLQDVRKELGYEDTNKLKQDVDHIQDWVLKQNHFRRKQFDDHFIERVLIYNKGSVERTKQKFEQTATCINLMPEFLQNFDIVNGFHAIQKIGNIYVLPMPTNGNYRIWVSQLNGEDDEDYRFIDYFRYLLVLGYYLQNNDYCLGHEFVVDTRKLTMNVFTSINPVVVHKAYLLIVKIVGHRLRRIHMISGNRLFNTMFTILKAPLSEKLSNRIIIHPNIESLHRYYPREQLPEELGGVFGTGKELNDAVFKELCSEKHVNTMALFEQSSTDESLRLSSKFNEEYSGTPGSFKVLCID